MPNLNIRISQDLLDRFNKSCKDKLTNKTAVLIDFIEDFVHENTIEKMKQSNKNIDYNNIESLIEAKLEKRLEVLNLQENIKDAIISNEINPIKEDIKKLEEKLRLNDNTLEEEHNIAIHIKNKISAMENKNNALWSKWYEQQELKKLEPNVMIDNDDKGKNKIILSEAKLKKIKKIIDLSPLNETNPIVWLYECDLNSSSTKPKERYWLRNEKLRTICTILGIKHNSKSNREFLNGKIKEYCKKYIDSNNKK